MSARTANASDIIPQVRVLKHAIKKMADDPRLSALGNTVAAISRSLDSRFSKYEEDEKLIAATFLDPRYKNTLYQPSGVEDKSHIDSITTFLSDSLKKMLRSLKDHEEAISSGSADEELDRETESNLQNLETHDVFESTSEAMSYDFDTCFEDLMSTSSEPKSSEGNSKSEKKRKSGSHHDTHSAVKREVEKFCSLPLEPRDSDPLIWWGQNKDSFPEIRKIANKMLCSPPSSVESERLFSIGGNVYTPHRSRLTPETGEKLMSLNFNLRVFNFDY